MADREEEEDSVVDSLERGERLMPCYVTHPFMNENF